MKLISFYYNFEIQEEEILHFISAVQSQNNKTKI